MLKTECVVHWIAEWETAGLFVVISVKIFVSKCSFCAQISQVSEVFCRQTGQSFLPCLYFLHRRALNFRNSLQLPQISLKLSRMRKQWHHWVRKSHFSHSPPLLTLLLGDLWWCSFSGHLSEVNRPVLSAKLARWYFFLCSELNQWEQYSLSTFCAS